ncbi:DUF2827 domain-containing protein [Glaciimonas soli]|uniref:DUF2827 family protein n=1 Tax=Glaciimonas soli TaxID=2590999 RepID=A0A843YSX0_9BURK|nr:DUF2827 domain-containing protein [Glaciimonas soli]MQR02799.1 DUF2827 family protein [Glaciimonas soli]
MKKINVGISVFAVQGAQLWANGINQNLAFLVMLLQQSPQVGRVFLLNGGDLDHMPAAMGLDGLGVPLVKPGDVTYELDVVIEMGAQLPLEWLRHVRALGVKIIAFFVGHTFADNAEAPMFDGPSGHIFNGAPWHEIWTLPHHMKSSGPLLRTVSRVPVFAVPHIWSPLFIQAQVDLVEKDGHHFGYQAGSGADRRGWRTAIFEPNISVVKNCFIPMLVCEQAFRLDQRSVSTMMVMNTVHMKEHPTFNRFAINLDLTRQHKASYEPRVAFVECMAQQKMDAVVSHQWECGLNYLYYDTLYGGYPLIHNSEYLKADGIGIYYPDFEASAGGHALLDAWRQEPEFWDDYKITGAAYLRRLAPEHPKNVDAFVKRLQHTVKGQV